MARDMKMTTRRPRTRETSSGFTLIELLVVMACFAVMVGTTAASLPRNPYGAWSAQAALIAEIRRVRNEALTKGDHFMLEITGPTSWASYRLTLDPDDDEWLVDGPPVRSGTLPDGTSFLTGINSEFEFTTRGLMVIPEAAITVLLNDSATNIHRGVTVWPSGQVSPS